MNQSDEITQSKQDESSIWVEPEAYDDTFKYKVKERFQNRCNGQSP